MLLLDEPTRGIDVGAKAEVQSLIDELASEGLGVVLVSSDAEELIEGADRVVVLRDGVVVGILTGEHVTTEDLLETIAAAAVASLRRRTPMSTEAVPAADRPSIDVARLRAWLPAYGVYVAILLLVLYNVLFTPNFLAWSNVRIQLIQVAPIVIVALGMALVIGTEGIDLSVGSVMALAAALIPLYLGYGVVAAIVVVADRRRGRRADQRHAGGPGRVAADRGDARVVRRRSRAGAGHLRAASSRTYGIRICCISASGDLIGVPVLVWIAAVLVVIVALLVRRTVFGRRLLAIGGNRASSELAGLPVKRVLITVYVICSVLASIAGMLAVARIQSSDASAVGLLIELSAITAVVVGGTPLTGGRVRVLGTVAGALLMQLVVATMIKHDLQPSTTEIVQAVIILIAVYVARERKTR